MIVSAPPAPTGVLPGWSLRCDRCGHVAAPGVAPAGCPVCAAAGFTRALTVAYDAPGELPPPERSAAGVWKYGSFLPAVAPEHRRTLGEGDTPLVQVPALAELTGNPNIWLKLELCNPTAAHKDRFHAVTVGAARALGYDGIVSASTGNHGLSMSCYAAAHGMAAVVCGNPRMPPLIQRAIRFAGGLPLLSDHALTGQILERMVAEGWFPSTTSWPMPVANPYGIEGYKTIACEVYQALGNRMPGYVFFPAAGGDGVVGWDRAMTDLARAGYEHADATLIPCQPSGAAPLVNAMRKGLSHVEFLPDAFSRALSIGDPITGQLALEATRSREGFAEPVPDERIMAAGRLLAANGILVEPSSAASVAGAIQVLERLPELRDETIVCLITSSGLKWLDDYDETPLPGGEPVASVDDALRAAERHLKAAATA